MSYVELTLLHVGPSKPSVLAKWAEAAPTGSIGLVAPFPLTHRTAPTGTKRWAHDASTGDFRASELARATIAPLREAVDAVHAGCVIFRSPESFSPSAANRDTLRAFFAELASAEAIGTERVWVPGGLWDVRTAVKLAGELGVICALDPLVREPGASEDPHDDLEVESLYLRIGGLGRAGALRNEQLEDLEVLLEHYEELPITVAFNSPERWHDARNFRKLLTD